MRWRRSRRCEARGSRGRSLVFAGKRPPSELPVSWPRWHARVAPLQGTNTPFKIYTYLAAGKPLVATRIQTHTQLLDDSLAFLVEPTPSGLALGIRAVLGQPAEARARAGRGRALIEREYSPWRFARRSWPPTPR